MTILKGYDSYLGFREVSQTTEFATGPAEFLFSDDITLSRTKEEELIQELGFGARGHRRRVTKNIEASLGFSKSIDPNNGIALYQYVLAGSVTSASLSSATFSHTFSAGDDVPSQTRLQFEAAIGGSSATTLRFYNGIVESYGLTVEAGNIAKENFSVKFSNHGSAINTQNTVALTYTEPITSKNVVVSLGLTITAVSSVACKDIALNITNALSENRELGSDEVKNFNYDMLEVNGSFNLTFEDFTKYNTYINETYSALQIALTSKDVTSTTSHSIVWKLPQIYFNGATPAVGATGEIVQPIEFTAIYSTNAGYQVQVVVTNADSAVTK